MWRSAVRREPGAGIRLSRPAGRMGPPRRTVAPAAAGPRCLLLLGEGAARVQILDVAALGARGRIDDGIDQRRLARRERFADGFCQARRVGDVIAGPAEGLDDPVVARVPDE